MEPHKQAPSSYAVTYVASGLHPCCPELVAHYYALRLKKKTSSTAERNVSFTSASGLGGSSATAPSSPFQRPKSNAGHHAGGVEVIVIVGLLEYDYLVQQIFAKLQERRSSGLLSEQFATHQQHQLHNMDAALHSSGSSAFLPWAANEGFVEKEWCSLSALSTPGESIMRALRASRVTTLYLPDQEHASAFHRQVSQVADRGGHFLSQYDLARDVIPAVTAYAARSMIGVVNGEDDGSEQEDTPSSSTMPSSSQSPPQQQQQPAKQQPAKQQHNTLPTAMTAKMLQENEVIFLHVSPGGMAFHDDGDRSSTRRSASYSAQTFTCKRLQQPRPIITRSPRTYALWLRIQIMRDAVDLLIESDARSGRRHTMDPLIDGQLWTVMTLPSDKKLMNVAMPRSAPSRAAQIFQIRRTFDINGGSQEAIFLPRFRSIGHFNGRLRGSSGGSSSGAMHHHHHPDDAHLHGATLSTRYKGAGTEGIAPGMLSLYSLDARDLELQRRIPKEQVLQVLQVWLDILIRLAPNMPWLFATVLNEANTLTGFVDAGMDALENINAGGGGNSPDDFYPATKAYLLELEKLRRRRWTMVQSVVVTASVAAKNDLTQSNVVRIIETWVRERFEKTIGQVGNLVGARMTVDPNWNTEAHPVFGVAMRATHFPFFSADEVMLDGCMTPLIPLPVMRCRNEWRRVVQLDPVLYRFRTLTVRMAATVAKLSKRLVCSPGDLSLLPNREAAISTILRSLPLLPGDTVLLVDPPIDGCFTNIASFLERRFGVEVQVLRLDPYATNDVLERAFMNTIERVRPVLCMMSWVAPSTRVLPVAYFVSLCGQKAILTVVDGTEAVGNISVNVSALDCDVFVARLDNYMFSPVGVTALVVKPKMNKLLTTLTVSYYYRPPIIGDAVAKAADDDDEREGIEADLFGGGTQVSPWGHIEELGDDQSGSEEEPVVTNTSIAGGGGGGTRDRQRTGGASHEARLNKAYAGGLPVVGGSVYGSEWWYTGLNDMSSALAVTQSLQFKKFICFGAKEYCFRIAQEAEEFLCRVWQVKPLLPLKHSPRHSILCVEFPRSSGKGSPDAAHLQQQFREHNVCVTVLALPMPPPAAAGRGSGGGDNNSVPTTRSVTPVLTTTPAYRAQNATLLAVRITVQVYNAMRDIKHLAAAGVRIVTSSGW
ncbi:aminotransferase, putative [Bodo saltans]|uniref:Aminotransferase, putative n=1 Tax=Bodo saltans TaxID=75058 RepID=A0A0S4IWU6_BODSA|nr:aminotransferase, putative [Bodo saltans]|eukprot:CUG32748.1 aminotransferase, putative [Bodo saltans]